MIKKCSGCGILLQTIDKSQEGYVDSLDKDLCERCFKIKNYGEYQSTTLNNEDYLKVIENIPKESLVVYLTSVLDINLDYAKKFPHLLIVLTKKDLLPKSVKDYKLINYVTNIIPNYLDIEVISSIKNYNLDNLISKIKRHSHSKDIYIVGMTNSGKSTLINKLIKNYSNQNSELTTSMYPSTTLNTVKLKIDNLSIIDTPGFISPGSILNYLIPSEIKKITPKKEIKPRSYQLKGNNSFTIDNLLTITYYDDTNITIYIANNINITKINPNNSKISKDYEYSFSLSANKDIVIEDLCFIKFTKSCRVDIFCPYKLNIYERDNLI